MHRQHNHSLGALWAIVALLLSGCGGDGRPSLVSVEGTVTFNGAPLADADVVFQVVEVAGDYNRPSHGRTDAQGQFTIGTYGADDGIPMGTYKVGVVKREPLGAAVDPNAEEVPSGRPLRFKWAIPRSYGSPESSGLTVEVTSDGLQPETIALQGEAGEIEVVGQVVNDA